MNDFRPSPALRRLYSQRDKSFNVWLGQCACYYANRNSEVWKARYAEQVERWGKAFNVLANIAWEQEEKERMEHGPVLEGKGLPRFVGMVNNRSDTLKLLWHEYHVALWWWGHSEGDEGRRWRAALDTLHEMALGQEQEEG